MLSGFEIFKFFVSDHLKSKFDISIGNNNFILFDTQNFAYIF